MSQTHTQTIRVVSVLPDGAGVFALRDGRWRLSRRIIARWPRDRWERGVAMRLIARARGLPFDAAIGREWLAEGRRLRAEDHGFTAIERRIGGARARWPGWLGEATVESGWVRPVADALHLTPTDYLALRARCPKGVSPGAVLLLAHVAGQTLAQLAILTRRHESTTSLYLRQLERGRLAVPHGPRPVRWDPTDAGRALVTALAPTVAVVERRTA